MTAPAPPRGEGDDNPVTRNDADTMGRKTNGEEKVNEDSSDRQAPLSVDTTTSEKSDKPIADTTDDTRSAAPQESPLSPRSAIPQSGISEWSHQHVVPQNKVEVVEEEEEQWQDMPSFAPYDIYDDDGKLIAKESVEEGGDVDTSAYMGYTNLRGGPKGYTRVQMDEDVQSATSMDDNTAYLFNGNNIHTLDEDEEARDVLTQMQTTKTLLSDTQRIAYVGIVKLATVKMVRDLANLERTRSAKKSLELASEAMLLWAQKMMVRLYSHMELDPAEQIMIEQLAEHGLEAEDLTPSLMQSSKVKNPIHERPEPDRNGSSEVVQDRSTPSPRPSSDDPDTDTLAISDSYALSDDGEARVPKVARPSSILKEKNLEIDLRWTVLCDLFLILISDSSYDARSRVLLELVAGFLDVTFVDVCRFEKRVTEALEMEDEAQTEDLDETEHMEQRRKRALRRRLAFMGLATVGGGLIIGLTAGLLAPVIGAGLAAGFTTIGVTGTSGFLAGAGGAAVIGTVGTVTGGTVGVRAANRRTGAVKTFEYRPLHNNKRVNLIVTIAGWITGKVDDVRLPYSTVDPAMGDIFSVLWEPDMLRSMGATINILATEALTQGLQQILGSTILIALMSALQAPILLTKLSYLIDNPWSTSVAKADMAGLILADSLIDRSLGARPITLVGFSLGSRVIMSALKELAKKGAIGIVQNVYVFGTPVVIKKDEILKIKSIVAGRFVNGYATNDWILGYLFRATSGGIMRVAGLAQINVPGVENFDVTKHVPGHMSYRTAMPKLLREVGWLVESDEFTEIEDPDPDNHEKRQRELINEIEEARKELQDKPEKRRFGIFRRNKKRAQKKDWETYDERFKQEPDERVGDPTGPLFDLEAIRREIVELAAEGIEIKELETTMPPMRIGVDSRSTSDVRSEGSTPAIRAAAARNYSAEQLPPIPSTSKEDPGSKSLDDVGQSYFMHKRTDSDKLSFAQDEISMTFDSPQPKAPTSRPPRSDSYRGNQDWRPQSPPRTRIESSYESSGTPRLSARSSPHITMPQPPRTRSPSPAPLPPPKPLLYQHDTGSRNSLSSRSTNKPTPPLPSSQMSTTFSHDRNPWDDDDKNDDIKMTFE